MYERIEGKANLKVKQKKIVGPRVLENYKFLQDITKTKSIKKRSAIIKNASPNELLTIVEVAKNILSSNFPLTGRQKNRLLPFVDSIRKISRARSKLGTRKFIQNGNGLNIIPSLLLPIIVEAAKHLITAN